MKTWMICRNFLSSPKESFFADAGSRVAMLNRESSRLEGAAEWAGTHIGFVMDGIAPMKIMADINCSDVKFNISIFHRIGNVFNTHEAEEADEHRAVLDGDAAAARLK